MSWRDLSKLINKAVEEGFYEVEMLSHVTELKPVLASAEQTSDGGERTESLDGGWQLRYTIDPGGGSASITGEELDGYEVQVEVDSILELLQQRNFDSSTLTWEDLGASFPDPSELSVMPDNGAVPSLDGSSLVLVAPDGTEYADGDDCDGEPVTIVVEDQQFDGTGVLAFALTVNVPGVAGAPNGTVEVETELDCSICASYEVEPPDADALDSFAEEALEAAQELFDAAEAQARAEDEASEEDEEDEDDDFFGLDLGAVGEDESKDDSEDDDDED